MSQFDTLEIKKGNETAFRIFFDSTYPRVLGYLIKLCKQRTTAEDIAQEAYLKLWNKRSNINTAENLEAYLFTIVRNTFLTYTKKAIREQQHLGGFLNDLSALTEPSPGSQLEAQEQHTILQTSLQQLSSQKQKYFLLSREGGLTYKQIAEQEGVSQKTVEAHISSVLKVLRSNLTSFFFFYW